MRVLQLTTHLNIGGVGNYVVSLVRTLKARGATCIVASSGGDLEGELSRAGIMHKRVALATKSELSPKILIATRQAVRLIRAEQIDIIHAHTRVSQVVARFASKITGVPYVTTCHGHFKKRFRAIFDTWGARIIAISDAVKIHLETDLAVRPDRIQVIYSGVDTARFGKVCMASEIENIKRSFGFSPGPVIGTIGRLSPVKGQRYFIDAMQHISAARPDVQALIVGNGPDEAALKDLAIRLNVDHSIRFVNANVDTRQFLSIMDVFVFPSVAEGLGIALLEAMAAGKACVASRAGGITDIITDGKNGLLFDVGDSEAMAAAVLRLLDDKELRDKFSAAGRALVQERFSLDRWVSEVMGLYKQVIGPRS